MYCWPSPLTAADGPWGVGFYSYMVTETPINLQVDRMQAMMQADMQKRKRN